MTMDWPRIDGHTPGPWVTDGVVVWAADGDTPVAVTTSRHENDLVKVAAHAPLCGLENTDLLTLFGPHLCDVPGCPGPKLVAQLEAAEKLSEWAEHRDHTCGYKEPGTGMPSFEFIAANGHRFWCTCGLAEILSAYESARATEEEVNG